LSAGRNILYTFLTQIPTLLFQVTSGILITRILGAGGQGVFVVVQADMELLVLLLGFSLQTGLIFFIANKRIPENVMAGMALLFLIGGALLSWISLAGLWFFETAGRFVPADESRLHYYAYIAAAFLVNSFNVFMTAFFQGRSLFKIINRMTLLGSAINLAAYSTAFYLWQTGQAQLQVWHLLFIGLGSLCVNAVIWLICYARLIGVRPVFRFSFVHHVKPLFVFILLGHFSHVLNFFTYKLDIWIINHYNTEAQVGLYARAVGIAQLFWLISNPIMGVLAPTLSRPDAPDKLSTFTFFSKFNFMSVFVLMIIAAALAPVLFPLVYGEEFAGSVLPFFVLLPGILFSCINKLFSIYIFSQEKVKYNFLSTVAGVIITITLDLLLIPHFGIMGAAWATFFAYFGMMIASACFLFGPLKLPFRNYYLFSLSEIAALKRKLNSFVFSNGKQEKDR